MTDFPAAAGFHLEKLGVNLVGYHPAAATAARGERAPMLSWEVWMDIKHLHKEGHSIKAITRLTGHSRNTVRRILRQKTRPPFQKPTRDSLLDEFKPYVTKRYQECALSSVRLFAEIKPMGYRGSLATLRRFAHILQAQQRAQSKLTVRYEPLAIMTKTMTRGSRERTGEHRGVLGSTGSVNHLNSLVHIGLVVV